ncbi:MAG: hypothetical protein J0L76_01440 [Rhodobacterales bacterium]|nr:hypothetical protein [Rhodobacterales bacterium]
MTRRKDPQPETLQPETATTEPFVAEVDPEPVTPPQPAVEAELAVEPPLQPPSARRPGVLGPLLGGALAAIGGFALSHFNLLGLQATASSAEIAALTAELGTLRAGQTAAQDKLAGEVQALSGRLATLETAPAMPDLSRLDALDQRLAAIEAIPADGNASTAALTARIVGLEERVASAPGGGTDPALQQKLDEALARLTEAESAATARASEAEAATTAATRAKAIDALTVAIRSGQPFAAELTALNDTALSAALGGSAGSGVPTLAGLQAAFPDAAREALRVARDISPQDGWSDRLVDFLAAQTGARSVTPREGSEPDAVLSRAEFALGEGRVADALAEIDPLDPVIKAPLQAWTDLARAHLAAETALSAARGE